NVGGGIALKVHRVQTSVCVYPAITICGRTYAINCALEPENHHIGEMLIRGRVRDYPIGISPIRKAETTETTSVSAHKLDAIVRNVKAVFLCAYQKTVDHTAPDIRGP